MFYSGQQEKTTQTPNHTHTHTHNTYDGNNNKLD